VAALSPVTLVVEAGQNSGSLITARYAKLFSKKVCVITGSIFNEHIGGIIELLRQGAFPLQNIDELVNLYNWKAINSIQVEPNIEKSTNLILDFKQLSPMEQSILDLIVHGGENINALCRELKMDASKVLILLTEMQMKNVIYEKGGQYYANNA
jgi:DNA processing protein